MRKGIGRIHKVGNSIYVRIDKYVAKDTIFPFELGEIVVVRIEKGKLIIEKKPNEAKA